MKSTKKQAILHSLEAMDDSKMDHVMKFINNLFWDGVKNPVRQKIKEKAIKQIQRALQRNGKQAPFVY